MLYLGCIAASLPLLFLALVAANRGGAAIVAAILLMAAGIGLLIFALLIRAAARCPRCHASLIWKKGPIIGTGRVSLGVKKNCPECKLDLNAP